MVWSYFYFGRRQDEGDTLLCSTFRLQLKNRTKLQWFGPVFISSRNLEHSRVSPSSWGAHFDVLQTSTTALAFAPAEYCSPVWCRSAHTHRLDAALNNGLRLVSGCIRSTPTFMLPVVSGIMPPDTLRNKQYLALSCRAEADDQHALHNIVTASTPVRKRLQSRHPFSEHAKQLTSDAHGKTNRAWAEGTWETRWDITLPI